MDPTPREVGKWIGGPVKDPLTTWSTNNWDPRWNIIVFYFNSVVIGNPVLPGDCGTDGEHGSAGFGTHG